MPKQLAETVDALLSALNERRAADAEALVRPEVWDRGERSPASMAADETLLLQAFPGMLEANGGRAAVRVMGFYKEGGRTQWWFFFEEEPEGWILSSIGTTRLDAERFLKGIAIAKKPVEPEDQTGGPLSGVPPKLRTAVERLAAALHEGDVDAAKALADPKAWDAPDHSPMKLANKIGRLKPDVATLEARVQGDRAAVQVGFMGEKAAGDAWLVFKLVSGLGWRWIGATTRWEPAGVYVTRLTDALPVWKDLPGDEDAERWADGIVDAVRAGEGIEGFDDASWAQLSAVPEGHEVRTGEIRVLRDRAAIEIAFVDPARPDEPDSRFAVLERAGADAPWTFREVSHARGLSTLLDGVEIPWAPEPIAEEPLPDEDALREAVKKKVFKVLEEQGIAPGSVDDLSKLPKETIEKVLPDLVGGAFSALFGTLMGQMASSLEEAAARDPKVTVDLDAERRKRAGRATPKEDPIAREVKAALRDTLRSATKDGATKVDREFLKDEGPKLIGSLLGAFAKAVTPAEIELDVTDPTKPGEKPTKVKVELGDIVGKLFAEASKPAPEPPEPAADDDEES